MKSNSCTTVRRMLIQHGSLSITTGELTHSHEEWVTKPCNVPMFSDVEKARGTCKACDSGWTHPHNFKVETP